MLRFAIVLSLPIFACSSQSPTPMAPAGKAISDIQKPTDLVVVDTSAVSVLVQWGLVDGATDYDVAYRMTEPEDAP